MLEMGTSGLMSGDGKRGGFNVSTRVRPRLYNRLWEGHGFSHAVRTSTRMRALAPEGMALYRVGSL
jgi:hypothetical protein